MQTSLFASFAASSAVTQDLGCAANAASGYSNRTSAKRPIATHIPGKKQITPCSGLRLVFHVLRIDSHLNAQVEGFARARVNDLCDRNEPRGVSEECVDAWL